MTDWIPLPDPAQSDHWLQQVTDEQHPTEQRLEALAHLLAYQDALITVEWLTQLMANVDQPVSLRCAVALGLGSLGFEEAVEALLANRQDDSPLLRRYIVEALASVNTAAVLPALVEALDDPDNQVFAAAAEGLGQLGDLAVPVLCQVLKEGADDARCVAAWQLGEVGAREAIDGLVSQARQDHNMEVQALCLWALGEIGHADPSVVSLMQWARTQTAPELRLRAETALKKIVRHIN